MLFYQAPYLLLAASLSGLPVTEHGLPAYLRDVARLLSAGTETDRATGRIDAAGLNSEDRAVLAVHLADLICLQPSRQDDLADQDKFGQQFSIQDDHYQLIVTLPENTLELLRLDDDPGTQPNRAADLPEVRDRLRRALDEWMTRVQPPETLDLQVEAERVEDLKALGYL